MCTLHDFLSNKIRFIDTSTVSGSHSCSGKKYAYILFVKQQLVHDERKFVKHFEQLCRDMYIQDGFNDTQISSGCWMYKEIKQVRKPEVYFCQH